MPRQRRIIREQTRQQLDAAAALASVQPPKLGWIRTTRLALGMTGAALSQRLGGTRSLAANLERSEQDGRIELKSLRQAAAAMNCRLVYGFVPAASGKPGAPLSFEALVEAQAERVARRRVRNAAVHMALEAQQLDARETEREVRRLKDELLRELPRNLWAPGDDERR